MRGACTTCMGVCSSGARIGTVIITTRRVRAKIQRDRRRGRIVSSEAGVGLPPPNSAGRPTELEKNRKTGSMTSAFVLPCVLPNERQEENLGTVRGEMVDFDSGTTARSRRFNTYPLPIACCRCSRESNLARDAAQRGNNKLNMLIEIDAEFLRTKHDILAANATGEPLVFHL